MLTSSRYMRRGYAPIVGFGGWSHVPAAEHRAANGSRQCANVALRPSKMNILLKFSCGCAILDGKVADWITDEWGMREYALDDSRCLIGIVDYRTDRLGHVSWLNSHLADSSDYRSRDADF